MISTEFKTAHGNGCIVTAASTTSWCDERFKVCAGGLTIGRNFVLARVSTVRAKILMVIVMVKIVAVMVMIVFFAEGSMHHAKCCVVTSACTTSWTDFMFKVPTAGLMILILILARHQTRRKIVMLIIVAVMVVVVEFCMMSTEFK